MKNSIRRGAQYAILLVKWTKTFVLGLSPTEDESVCVCAHLKKEGPTNIISNRYKD